MALNVVICDLNQNVLTDEWNGSYSVRQRQEVWSNVCPPRLLLRLRRLYFSFQSKLLRQVVLSVSNRVMPSTRRDVLRWSIGADGFDDERMYKESARGSRVTVCKI